MRDERVSEVVGAESAELLDSFMRESGIPVVILVEPSEANVVQGHGVTLDYVELARVLRQLARKVEARAAPVSAEVH